jgi:hypothetical protein
MTSPPIAATVTTACTVLTVTVTVTVAIAADTVCRVSVIVTITITVISAIGIGTTLAMTLILVWILESVTSKAVILTVWMQQGLSAVADVHYVRETHRRLHHVGGDVSRISVKTYRTGRQYG